MYAFGEEIEYKETTEKTFKLIKRSGISGIDGLHPRIALFACEHINWAF